HGSRFTAYHFHPPFAAPSAPCSVHSCSNAFCEWALMVFVASSRLRNMALKIVSTLCSAPGGFSPTLVRSRSSRPTSYIVGWLSLSRRRSAGRASRYVIPVCHETHGPSACCAGFQENHSF